MTIYYPYRAKKAKKKITFDGLGKFDWAGAIGTAASLYTGQPNALNNPQAQIAAAIQPPVTVQYTQPMGPPMPMPIKKAWYQQPVVWGISAVGVLGLTLVLMRSRRGRR